MKRKCKQWWSTKWPSTSHLKPFNTKKDHHIWRRWKSRCYLGTGTKMWRG